MNAIAKGIVEKLFQAGYIAYFAGGFVRDYLLGKESDEIDIATSATPDEIQALFPKTIPVGLAFGVVIVVLDGKNFEVSTFRKDQNYKDGRHPESVTFSNPIHDAQRRDFTINGMFYNPLTDEIFDYVGGREDLKKGIIRAIGNPSLRFEEDRLRMIRAIRFSIRFNFPIEKETREAILRYAESLLPSVSMERVNQELSKMTKDGKIVSGLLEMHRLTLLDKIFPEIKGMTLQEMESRLNPAAYFPISLNFLFYIFELILEATFEEKINLAKRLKCTRDEIEKLEFFEKSRKILLNSHLDSSLAHFYANPFSEECLLYYASKMKPNKRTLFLTHHEDKKVKLKNAIERIQKKEPLVGSARLLKEGIKPGISLGVLLKLAEKIAIDEKIEDPDEIIERLKKSEHWS